MTRHRLLLVSFLLSACAGASNLQSRFELQQALDGTFQAGQQGRLVLAGEVFGQTRNFPNDLRIFAPDGTQWPFFLHVPQAEPDAKKAEALYRSLLG